MMIWSTSLGSFLALDNVAVAMALAPICHKAGRLRLLAAWFAGVELVAPMVGALLHGILPAAMPTASLQTALLATLGLAVVGLCLAQRDPVRLIAGGGTIAALAVLLGLDNLMAGAVVSLPVATAWGLVGAGSVLIACAVGRTLGSRLSPAGCAAALLASAIAIGWA
jgi:hypothetical protein